MESIRPGNGVVEKEDKVRHRKLHMIVALAQQR